MAATFGFSYGGQAAANLNLDKVAAAVMELAARQSVRIAPTTNLAAGDAYVQGNLFGVATEDGTPGSYSHFQVAGTVTLTKLGGFTLAVGDLVWVDKNAKVCSATAQNKTRIVGIALETAPTAAGPLQVLIVPSTVASL